ncbi:MAG: hypothetical protein IT350_20655 [Deltaproteobacteria bacterium]|nr:hypothetical protein [Deltaproteobacteria bacterium]
MKLSHPKKQLWLLPILLLVVSVCCMNCHDESERNAATPGGLWKQAQRRIGNPSLNPGSRIVPSDAVTFANGAIEISIEPSSGHIVSVRDIRKSISLLDTSTNLLGLTPFSIQLLESDGDGGYKPVDYGPRKGLSLHANPEIKRQEKARYPGGTSVTIAWKEERGWTFTATIDMPAAEGWAEFRFSASVPGAMIFSATWPQFAGLAMLSAGGGGDRFAAPIESGVEIRNPLAALRRMHQAEDFFLGDLQYPSGHEAMLPLVAYYSQAAGGGFALYARDDLWTERFFRFMHTRPAAPNGVPTLAVTSMNWAVDGPRGNEPGEFTQDRPVRLETMEYGDWAAAGEIYRRWAETQVWAQNVVKKRPEPRRSVFEKMGVGVFGLSSKVDQSEWMRVFHELFTGFVPGDGVLFTMGWDFGPNGADFGGYDYAFYQAGWIDKYWVPFRPGFTHAMRQVRERGDLVYPFVFDNFLHTGTPGWTGWHGNLLESKDLGAPWIEKAIVGFSGKIEPLSFDIKDVDGDVHSICPAASKTRDFIEWRRNLLEHEGDLAADRVMDGLYYDIPVTLLGQYCFDRLGGYSHDHPQMGWGRFITQSERRIFERAAQTDPDFGFGIENVTEPFVDFIDYYHLGAPGDGPYRSSDGKSPADAPRFVKLNRLLMEGWARQIPLMEYVTHAFGPVRVGGKVQISDTIGDAWYWVAAYNYINGGLLELIYYNEHPELFATIRPEAVSCPGGYPCSFKTGWIDRAGLRGWTKDNLKEADPDKVEYLRRCIELRLALGNPWLTAGRMLPPPGLDPIPAPVSFSYDFYSSINGPTHEHRGDWPSQPVIVSAFAAPGDPKRIAFFVANASDQSIATSLVFKGERYGLANPIGVRATRPGAEPAATVVVSPGPQGFYRIPLDLAAQDLVRIEVVVN